MNKFIVCNPSDEICEEKECNKFMFQNNYFERINRFHVGDTEISVIKVGGIPCDGKPNFKWPPVGSGARPHGNFCGASSGAS
jgi:hypothetical protein